MIFLPLKKQVPFLFPSIREFPIIVRNDKGSVIKGAGRNCQVDLSRGLIVPLTPLPSVRGGLILIDDGWRVRSATALFSRPLFFKEHYQKTLSMRLIYFFAQNKNSYLCKISVELRTQRHLGRAFQRDFLSFFLHNSLIVRLLQRGILGTK